VGDDAGFERDAADVDGGGALALAEEAGDGDLLDAEAFGDADGPLAADGGAGGGGLGKDAARRHVRGVETVFEVEAEAEAAGLLAGFEEGEAGEGGDFDLAAVDGEAHGEEGGDESHDEHGQRAEDDVEEAVDAAGNLHLHGGFRIYAWGMVYFPTHRKKRDGWGTLLTSCLPTIRKLSDEKSFYRY